MASHSPALRFQGAWRQNYTRKTLASAAASFGCTAVFALYHGYLGLRYGSIWHGSIGGFYLLLMAIRGSILLSEFRNRSRPLPMQNHCRRCTFRISAALLLMMDLALSHGGENFYDGWMKNPKSAMISCNDGFRPVSFLVEALEEDADENVKSIRRRIL